MGSENKFTCVSKECSSRQLSCTSSATSGRDTLMARAAYLGHTSCLKVLVEKHKAGIEEEGTNIETTDSEGISSLMVASYHGHQEIVKYLIDIGADVNRRRTDEKSALHACAESGRLEVMKMLLDHNARMNVDAFGTTPLLVASYFGQANIVAYLISRTDLTPATDKLDALELLGVTLITKMQNVAGALNCWKLAMNERYTDGVPIYPKTGHRLSNCSCDDFTEVTSLHQLEEIESDVDALEVQSLLAKERILGPSHFSTKRDFQSRGLSYVFRGNVKKCLRLWMHALHNDQDHYEPSNKGRLFHIKSFAGLFINLTTSQHPRYADSKPATYFEDFLRAFEMCIESIKVILSELNKADSSCGGSKPRGGAKRAIQAYRVTCIAMHFLFAVAKPLPDISPSQWHTVKKAVYKFVKAEPISDSGATLLHIACSIGAQMYGDLVPRRIFPSLEVVNLLLETGADPCATDFEGSTPLHALAEDLECPAGIANALLSAGAHLDAADDMGNTFESLRASRGQPLSHLVNAVRHTSLQCLAAASIRRHGIPYKNILHPRLEKFVDIH
ncbi:protein fem-1 homolog A-like isoform X2 [Macrobrachium rosenbergii]|uniref:protein fem-1 homolog A-like isoform X2 n=1 Tax=Macrobrachium rosenbergii TaxID=79674 RepID=UPI0034D60C4B